MNDTNDTDDSGFLQRMKDSPRTVSALIIILIVAAAIYAFSDRQPQQNEDNNNQETAVTDETSTPEGTTASGESTTSPTDQPTSTAATTAKPEATPLPEASRSDQGFTEVAQPGEGITHLARRASDRWLQENQAGYEVTAEHRVYIEDYIQNRIGTKGLSIGETKAINYDLISEAVNSAKNLSATQLKSLSRYTQR